MYPSELEFWPGLEAASNWISANGRQTEESGEGLGREMWRLHQDGLLVGCVPRAFGGAGLGQDCKDTLQTFEILRRLGRASLPVARLFEGHINAAKLIALYGRDDLKTEMFGLVSRGGILGVWGADGAHPVTYELHEIDTAVLSGIKIFASGLGCVTHAVVSAKSTGNLAASRLFVVDVSEAERQDPSAWLAAGMRSTLSGNYKFDGLRVLPNRMLGQPGDYEKEPYFDGGVWRYCAAHVGGAEALIEHALTALIERNQFENPLNLARMGHAIGSCRAGAAMVREWAVRVESAGPGQIDSPEEATAGVLLARAFVADMAMEVLQDCERCLGTSAHMTDMAVERLRRDLSLYIRQASPDAKLLKATRALCSQNREGRSLW